jgi:ketosteroid isomerase-like protein
MSHEAAIRELITRWAEAVHMGDLDAVLAEHDPDIVMFDVPPPYDGLRGIEQYRDSWPRSSNGSSPARSSRSWS